MSRFVAIDRKDEGEIPDLGDGRQMAFHERPVSRDQHIEITFSESCK